MAGSGNGPFGLLPRPSDEDKAAALADPGPTWRQYFYRDFAKWYGILGFLIVDSWVAAVWLQPFNPVALGLSIAAAGYLEYLLFQYLWRKPDDAMLREIQRSFRPSWIRPVAFGRWTEAGELARAGKPVGEGPDPDEFR